MVFYPQLRNRAVDFLWKGPFFRVREQKFRDLSKATAMPTHSELWKQNALR